MLTTDISEKLKFFLSFHNLIFNRSIYIWRGCTYAITVSVCLCIWTAFSNGVLMSLRNYSLIYGKLSFHKHSENRIFYKLKGKDYPIAASNL